MANGMRAAADRAQARQASTGARGAAHPPPPMTERPAGGRAELSDARPVYLVDGLPYLVLGGTLRGIIVADDDELRGMPAGEKAWRMRAADAAKKARGSRVLTMNVARMIGAGPRLTIAEVEHAVPHAGTFVAFTGQAQRASTADGWRAQAATRAAQVAALRAASKKISDAATNALRAGAVAEAAKLIVKKAQVDRKTLDVATVAKRDERVAVNMTGAESLREQAQVARRDAVKPGIRPDVSQGLMARAAIAEQQAASLENAARFAAAQPLPVVGDVDPEAARRLASELMTRAERLSAPALDVAASLRGMDPLSGVPFGMVYGGGRLGCAYAACEKRDVRGLAGALSGMDDDVGAALRGLARWNGITPSASQRALAGLIGMLGAADGRPPPVTSSDGYQNVVAPDADFSQVNAEARAAVVADRIAAGGRPPPPVPADPMVCKKTVIRPGVVGDVCKRQSVWDALAKQADVIVKGITGGNNKSKAKAKAKDATSATPKLPDVNLPPIPDGDPSAPDADPAIPGAEPEGLPWGIIGGVAAGLGVLGYLAWKS